MKKVLITVLAVALCVACVVSCVACAEKSDVKKVEKKGEIVIGVTLAEPMNYKVNEEWVGFDTEFAQAVGKELGLNVKFQIIKWGQKYIELESGTIDCIWNGFTANCADDDGINRADKVSLSHFYMFNEQCVVVKKANLDNFTSLESLKGKKGGAEMNSAGASFIGDAESELTVTKDSQIDIIPDVKSGSVDFVVMDRTLADRIIGKGDNADLAIVSAIKPAGEPEKYAIGFRKGSDLTEKVNEVMVTLAKNGTLKKIAEKYGLENLLITDYAE